VDASEPDRRASADAVCQWVQRYVDRWELKESIKFRTEVVTCVEKLDGWHVLLRDLESGDEYAYLAKSVLVCTGLENLPKMAKLPGSETATMPIVHNLSIRDKSELPDREVLIIGAGPSSMDIIQEACRNGTKKVVALHRKAHLGMPDSFGIQEMKFLRFMFQTLRLPNFVVAFVINTLSLLWTLINGIPSWKPVDVNVTKDVAYAFRSELVAHVKCGRLTPVIAGVEKIEGDKVILTNGTVLHPQLIVCATGWNLDYKFLPSHDGLTYDQMMQRMYCRFMDVDHKNLFFVSVANGFMCATHSADYVSRCIIQILTGEWTPKSKTSLRENIENVVTKGLALPGKYEMELEHEGFRMRC